MNSTKSIIRKSYITLRGINLGAAFMSESELVPGQRYSMVVSEIGDDLAGTLDKSGFIGGLAKMYRLYDLAEGDGVEVEYDGTMLHITPPSDKRRSPEHAEEASQDSGEVESEDGDSVFDRQSLRHVHIETYAPGNLRNWTPRTEPDVYMVFGALAEYTDYRYCCGVNQALIDQLGYEADAKPDAVLIDRATGQYLMAEFKVNSKDFTSNHKKDDVDVLVCWSHDNTDLSVLPPTIVDLKTLLETAIKEGNIDV
jgi:hypothetical protein